MFDRLLLIHTCGSRGFVALADPTGVLEATELPTQGTSEAILPALHQLFPCGFKGVDVVGLVLGPGSFTGVRVGLSTAKGLCEAADCRLVAVSRLAMVAGAGVGEQTVALLDGGRGEFYAGTYSNGRCVSEKLLGQAAVEKLLLQGTAVTCEPRVAERLSGRVLVVPEPDERALYTTVRQRIEAGGWSDVARVDANYIRRTDAELLKSRRVEGVSEIITVRPATKADLSRIVALARECDTAPRWTEVEYHRIVRGESAVRRCLLVAEGGLAVSGFAVGRVAADMGELENLAVSPAFRRRGIAQALCQAVIAWCRSEGAYGVELEVRAASEGARKLYQRTGFKEAGRRPRYYQSPPDDAILMRLDFAHLDSAASGSGLHGQMLDKDPGQEQD